MKRFNLLAVLGLSLLALSACTTNKNEAAKDPVVAAKDIAVSLRDNDFDRLSHIAVPPDVYAKLEANYKQKSAKQHAPTAEESKQFADNLATYTAADAEQKLFAKVQPKLAEVGPQIPMYVAIGSGGLGQMIAQSDKLSADEKTQANAALTAITKWATTAPLSDQEKAKQAIKVVVETVRSLNLTTLDAAQKMSYPEMLQKAGAGIGGLRKMLAVYGLDTDKALDSVKVEKKSEDGDNAVVTVSFSLLDTPIKFDASMVRVDGRWYSKHSVDMANEMLAKQAAETAPMQAAPAEAPAANASSAMPAPGEQPAPSASTDAPASAASSAGEQPSN